MSTDTVNQSVPAGVWTVDPVHSSISFAVTHNNVATFRSGFDTYEATLIGGESPKLEGNVDVQSIDIDEAQLKGHLMSPEFFDAERFPQLSFGANEISRAGDDLTIAGELTLKGHTEPVEITGHINDPAPDPYGGERLGLQLEAKVDRTRFGLNWNNPLPSGDPALANEVTIVVDLQLVKEI